MRIKLKSIFFLPEGAQGNVSCSNERQMIPESHSHAASISQREWIRPCRHLSVFWVVRLSAEEVYTCTIIFKEMTERRGEGAACWQMICLCGITVTHFKPLKRSESIVKLLGSQLIIRFWCFILRDNEKRTGCALISNQGVWTALSVC